MSEPKEWRPFKKQEQFAQIPDSVFEGLYGGAAGGGKSELLLLIPIMREWWKHPRFKGILFRRTYPELEKEVIPRSHEWYLSTGAKYNDQKKRWTFPSGAIMQFGHVEHESDVRKYDTTEYNYMAFDELTSFTEYMYTYLAFTRCRSSSPQLPSVVRSGTNPGNIGHGWVRARFVEPGPYGTILRDKLTGIKRIFIQSLVTDNPHIDPGYANRLAMLTDEAEKRAKLYGDWWTFSGQVFGEFRDLHFVGDPENAVHTIDPFPIPDWWPRILAIDWGYSAMLCALWGAISPDLRLYIYREYTCTQTKISEWAPDIGRASDQETLKSVVLCKSAWQNRGDELTIAQQFEKLSGLRVSQPDNDRISGKILLQEYIRWKQKSARKIPESGYNQEVGQKLLRNHGMKAYEDYLESFKPEVAEGNLPKLQIFRNCPEVRKAIPLCVYDKNHKEDVAEFNGDDPYDAARYLVKLAENYMRESPVAGHLDKLAKVMTDFERTGDYTQLHRRMERVERQAPKNVPVRRFVRRRCA